MVWIGYKVRQSINGITGIKQKKRISDRRGLSLSMDVSCYHTTKSHDESIKKKDSKKKKVELVED